MAVGGRRCGRQCQSLPFPACHHWHHFNACFILLPLFVPPLPAACRLGDNTYVGTFGAAGWGSKANDILSKVRGKDFRHEKTKKKRGTYRGGAIDFAVNSIKLGDDE